MVVSDKDSTSPEVKATRLLRVARNMLLAASKTCFSPQEAVKLGTDHLCVSVGLHCGEAIAGLIENDNSQPQFNFFGPTVKMAHLLLVTGAPMCIHMSDDFHKVLGKTESLFFTKCKCKHVSRSHKGESCLSFL
jgi:class 3 adenylate cyclase